jgi:hypothetical protein
MNIKELKERLDKEQFNPGMYSIGEDRPDTICIEKSNNEWHVYYMQTYGKKMYEKLFVSEQDACEYFYKEISNKPQYKLSALKESRRKHPEAYPD